MKLNSLVLFRCHIQVCLLRLPQLMCALHSQAECFFKIQRSKTYVLIRFDGALDSCKCGIQFLLSCMILTAVYVFLWLQWLPESARFHVASGQPEEALATLQRVAKENGKPMLLGRLVVDDSANLAPRGRVTHLIRSELRKTSLLLWFIW